MASGGVLPLELNHTDRCCKTARTGSFCVLGTLSEAFELFTITEEVRNLKSSLFFLYLSGFFCYSTCFQGWNLDALAKVQ